MCQASFNLRYATLVLSWCLLKDLRKLTGDATPGLVGNLMPGQGLRTQQTPLSHSGGKYEWRGLDRQ